MDAKARQDCIKEIDLLKVKNQRRGRRRHALCSVLLRCLSWDQPPQENNWSAPDGIDLCVQCVYAFSWSDTNARGCCAHKWEYDWECMCDYTVCAYLCVCVWIQQRYIPPGSHWLLLNTWSAFFFFPLLKSFFLMFKTKQQSGNLAASLVCFFLSSFFFCFALLFSLWWK